MSNSPPGRRRTLNVHEYAGAAAGTPDAASTTSETSTPTVPQRIEEPLWRDWSGETRVVSLRLPVELDEEIARQAARTGVPYGHLARGHLVAGLDQDDDEAVTRADRATRARTVGKRNARRQAQAHR
ncbi:MAG: hypothetical protein ABSG43_16215 [Solirubrobacteraceae bacterium]